jgi:hypothetical protein
MDTAEGEIAMLDVKPASLTDQIARVGAIGRSDLDRVRHEILTASIDWVAEYGEYQSGGWWTVSLYNESGDPGDVLIKDCQAGPTRLMHHLPKTRRLIDGLGVSVMWARLARLSANAFLWEHRDYGELDEREKHRLHIPLVSNPTAVLVLSGTRVRLRPGHFWRLTPTVQHGVCNLYGPDRLHLIIDCYADDGLRRLAAPELSADDVEQMPVAQPGEIDRTVAAARDLISLGYRRTAEATLLRQFFRYALPVGHTYDLIVDLYRSLGIDDEVRAWVHKKSVVIGG